MTTLTQNVHELTRPHLPAGATLNTEPVPALLDQLRKAVHAEATGRQSTSTDGTPLPLSAGAIDLQQEITKQAAIDLAEMRGMRIAKPCRLEDIIQGLAPAVDPDWHAYLERVTLEWVDGINNLVNPKKPRRKIHQPCPSCGVMFVGEERAPALTMNCWDAEEKMMHPSKWDAECAGCGATWVGDELEWLSLSIAA